MPFSKTRKRGSKLEKIPANMLIHIREGPPRDEGPSEFRKQIIIQQLTLIIPTAGQLGYRTLLLRSC